MVPWVTQKIQTSQPSIQSSSQFVPNHFISYLKTFCEADITTDFRWHILIIFKLFLHSGCPSHSFPLIQILSILQIQFKSQLFMNLIWHYLHWNCIYNIFYQQKIIYFLYNHLKLYLCVYIFSPNRPIIHPQSWRIYFVH